MRSVPRRSTHTIQRNAQRLRGTLRFNPSFVSRFSHTDAPMAEPPNYAPSLNPMVLHLQKLALELNCPSCLNLFTRPILLPCNHIFCGSCTPRSTHRESECSICKLPYTDKDLRPVPFVENILNIYKSLDATFSAHMSQIVSSDSENISRQCLVSETMDCDGKPGKEHVGTSGEGDSIGRQSIFYLTANKRVQVPCYDSSQSDFVRNDEFDKCSVPGDAENQKLGLPTKGGMTNHKGGSPNLQPAVLQVGAGGFKPKIKTNCMAQLQTGSSPSCGDDTKGGHDDSRGQGSTPAGKKGNERPAFASEEGHARELKRQKKADLGVPDISAIINGDIQHRDLHHVGSVASRVQLESNNRGLHSIVRPLVANKFVCAFCQSSRVSEATGSLLHYIKGKPVAGDKASNANVIHVHEKCIDWAPQVYFVGETVKNLEKELARSAKLKCGSCGLKGAALGCYEKSCRKSYHVPCAVEVVDCRWDLENFLVLCPAHSSIRFPNENSKSSKHASKNYSESNNMVSQQSKFWSASPAGTRKWVLCGSALSSEEKFLLLNFASMIGVTVTKSWNADVTHVIAATDVNGACTRTLKVLMAVMNGRWVLTINWVKSCMEAMHPMDEEPYEVRMDNHGCCEGPKTGRLRVLNNEPGVFNGLNFYFTGEFLAPYMRDLQELIIAAGGAITKTKEELLAKCHGCEATPSRTLVIYNLDPPKGCELGEEVSSVLQRLDEADKVAAEIGSQVIPHTWLLGSIAASKLQPFAN